MEVMVKAVVWLWPLTVLAKGGEWPIVGGGGGRGHGQLVGKVDGGRYLSVRQCCIHAGHVQVATVVGPLAAISRHKRRHPAAVGVTQGLALLRAVGEKVGAWWIPIERWTKIKHVSNWEESVQQKLFNNLTRPTLMKQIACFSSPMKSAIRVMLKHFSPVRTNVLGFTIDNQTARELPIHILSSFPIRKEMTIIQKSVAQRKEKKHPCSHTLMSVIPIQADKACNWHGATAKNKPSK